MKHDNFLFRNIKPFVETLFVLFLHSEDEVCPVYQLLGNTNPGRGLSACRAHMMCLAISIESLCRTATPFVPAANKYYIQAIKIIPASPFYISLSRQSCFFSYKARMI